jgi:hypothetical protein
LGAVLSEHHEVIGIARKAQAELIEMPVKAIEDDVCQKRRDDSPLRRAPGGSQEPTVFKHPASQEAFEEIEDFAVCNTIANGFHDDLMREVIKEALDIGIQDDLESLVVQLERMVYGHVAVAALDEAEGCRVEGWPEDGVQEPAKDFLGYPVSDHRNAEGTELSLLSVLGYKYPAQRQRLKRAAFEFPHESLQVFVTIGFEHLDALLIDPRRASISFHGLEGVAHETLIDSADQ